MKVKRNIPIPKKTSGRPFGSSKYESLISGDILEYHTIIKARSVNIAIQQFFVRNKKPLTTTVRKVGEGGKIWIIEKTNQ
jgi:hypothetical protein